MSQSPLSLTFARMSSTPTFNPLACATLHNKIVSRIATTAREEYGNIIVHNYFAAYDDANEIRSRLSESLVTFLENIDVPVGEQAINIAPHARLSNPEDLWGAIGGMDVLDREGPENWVALYRGDQECIEKQIAPQLPVPCGIYLIAITSTNFPIRHRGRKRLIFRP